MRMLEYNLQRFLLHPS